MLCPVPRKSKRPNLVSSTGCILIIFVVLFLSSACKGQNDSPDSVTPFVVRGIDAPKGRFPYMCSIRERGSGRHICGGTLIGKQWVMTAAHCLDPEKSSSAGMSPFLYCNIYEREEEDISKRFTPSRCYLHHLWDGDVRSGNDIALCQLETSASISIPDLSNVGDDYTKSDLFSVLGWGRTSARGSLADILQIGEALRYVLPSTCNEVEEWAGSIKNSMICAGFALPSTCRGDSGGPLLIRHDPVSLNKQEDPLLDLIVGITSFGLPNCEADAPGVYTRVSCYRPWIDCIMQGTEQDCRVHSPCGEDSSSSYPDDSTLCSGVQKSRTFDEADALKRMRTAISSDEAKTVKGILCEGLSANAVYGKRNNSLLLAAARHDAIESAKVLLQNGAQKEYKNIDGQAALSRAAEYGSDAVANLLIVSGVNIETRDEDEWTPLTYAARYNQPEIAKILIENGANIESRDNDSWTPLHLAAAENSVEVTKILVENGAIIDPEEHDEWTPLHLAARFNSTEVAEELISNGANIQAKTNRDFSPLHLAADHGSVRIVLVLLDENAVVDAPSNEGSTPLHLASSRGNVYIVWTLLKNGASRTKKDDYGSTPFDWICTLEFRHQPCTRNHRRALQTLLRP